ncbi:hypothetical protein MSHOH_0602 [Methanosarcina horonobensis HB-1 = JCM 15518]|uniref:Uncharacterized protein n=1 Tax=Methanosarcina horonobensis HB-1 = JCM 15518 TaxID=1434110 RepID=A0A0E3WSP5_9EURY|nr:hypothetical protein [Methanosarcina horonobensis]AKB77085.1 hypothetical protein MSHOH_0602 [Methanosarcina horonobensis HB-1 = JCM 15518]
MQPRNAPAITSEGKWTPINIRLKLTVTAKIQTKILNFPALGYKNTAKAKDIRECPLGIEYPVVQVTNRTASGLGTAKTGLRDIATAQENTSNTRKSIVSCLPLK